MSKTVTVAQLCLTLCNLIDYIVHGILQARILEWITFLFSRYLHNQGIKPRSPALQTGSLPAEPQGFFTSWAIKETTKQMRSSRILSKNWSKFSKSGFNSTWTVKFWMFKLDLEKVVEPEIKLPTSVGWSKKQEFQCFIDYAKAFDCVDHDNCGKFWKRWEYQTMWPTSWETCMQVRKQQLELDMEQQTSSK